MRDLQKLSVWALGGMLLLALASVGRGGLPAGTSAATYTAASSANVSEVPLGPSGFATYRITFTDMRPGDVAFEVLSTSEPSSFFVIADLTNNSSQDWAGLRMMLGTGSLDPGTATDHFEPFDPGGPDLAWCAFDPSSFPSPDLGLYEASWPQATLGADGSESIGFNIDIPHGLSTFTIRHVPMPEPGTLLLSGLPALALTARRRPRACRA